MATMMGSDLSQQAGVLRELWSILEVVDSSSWYAAAQHMQYGMV